MSLLRTSTQAQALVRRPIAISRSLPLSRSLATSTSSPAKSHAPSSATSGSGEPSSNPLGPSRTPLVLGALAITLVAGYYTFSNKAPPKTGSVKAIERALEPKKAANEGKKPSEGIVKRNL